MKNHLAVLLTICFLGFYHCKNAQKTQGSTTPTDNPATADVRRLVRPVNAGVLETFLPVESLGIARTMVSGERTEIADKNVIMASAEYKGTDQVLRITITDARSAAAGLTGLAPWMAGEVNNKWEQGYERTADVEGYKGFESYDRLHQTGQTSVVVNNRFVVSVHGERVAENDARAALKGVDLKKLAKLR